MCSGRSLEDEKGNIDSTKHKTDAEKEKLKTETLMNTYLDPYKEE